MKQYYKIIRLSFFLIIIIILIILLKKTIFKKYHYYEYLINKDHNIIVEEIYQKKKYYINIKVDNFIFPFINDYNYYKKNHIVKDILYYKDKNIICIMPVYQNDLNNEMLCKKDNNLMTYSNLKDYEPLKKYIKTVKKEKKHASFIDSSQTTNYYDYQIYNENIRNDLYIIKWNYKGLDIFNNNYKRVNLFNQDIYTNELGVLVNHLYLQANTKQAYNFNQFYIVDILTGKTKTWKIEFLISHDTYINGIIDNKVYLFDRDNLIQYEVDPYKQKIKIIGDKTINGKYYNGSWQNINIYNLKNEDLFFEIYNQEYYYENNTIYRNINNQKVIILEIQNISNILIKDNYIFFIKDDIIYAYNDKYGLKKIIKHNELYFNKNNIYDFYIKKN